MSVLSSSSSRSRSSSSASRNSPPYIILDYTPSSNSSRRTSSRRHRSKVPTAPRNAEAGVDATATRTATKGQNGIDGEHAERASDGAHAQTQELWVTTRTSFTQSESSVHIPPSHHHIQVNHRDFHLLHGQKLLIRNNGAPGEDGRHGQDGAAGGKGGNGFIGWSTKSAQYATKAHRFFSYQARRGIQESREPIIHPPAEGGDGSRGGDASSGGRGGDAADLVIKTSDPKTLLLLETETRGGRGGAPGIPGRGGTGGPGGTMPQPAPELQKYLNPSLLRAPSGRRGRDGANARSGARGRDASTTIEVYDSTRSRVVESGSSSFSLQIEGFTVRALNDDGIYEPGEDLMIENIIVRNNGDISLPEGCCLAMDPQEGLISNSTHIYLPKMRPHETLSVRDTIQVRISNDFSARNTDGPLNVQLHLEMFAFFEGYEHYPFEPYKSSPLIIQYPVRISSLQCDTTLGRGSQTVLRVGIENISNKRYGYEVGAEYAIHYKVTLGEDVHFVSSNDQKEVQYVSSLASSQESHSTVPSAPPLSQASSSPVQIFEHRIMLGYALPFYSSTSVSIEVFLRQKQVERRQKKLTVVPLFREDLIPVSDVLFFTDSSFTRAKFDFYERIFTLLKLEVNYFDVSHYGGFRREKGEGASAARAVDWAGKFPGKLIIIPVESRHHKSWLQGMDPQQLALHFEQSEESSVLVVGHALPNRRRLFSFLRGPSERVLSEEQELSTPYVFFPPSEKDLQSTVERIELKEYQKSGRTDHFTVQSYFKPRMLPGGIIRSRYSLGSGVLHRLVLKCYHRMLFYRCQSDLTTERDIDRGLLFQILCGLSFERRLEMLNTLSDFYGKNQQIPQEEIEQMIRNSIFAELYRLMARKRIQNHLQTINYLFKVYPHNKHIQVIFRGLKTILDKQKEGTSGLKFFGRKQQDPSSSQNSIYYNQLQSIVQDFSPEKNELYPSITDSVSNPPGLSLERQPQYLVDILDQQLEQRIQREDQAAFKRKMIIYGSSIAVSLVGFFMWNQCRSK